MVQLSLNERSHKRLDCPNCGGRNTLSVTKKQGKLYYNCFKASCDLKGIENVGRTISEIRSKVSKGAESHHRDFVLPDYFVSVTGEPLAFKWLQENNCEQAYFARRIDIRFDPRLRRVVFVSTNNNGTVIDACGRKLYYTPDRQPKWLRYGSSGLPINVVNPKAGRVATLVEDAASACAVSELVNGVALMGTHMTDEALAFIIEHYDTVYVALDKDARSKGIKLCRVLDNHCDVKFRPLEEDLKYLKPEQIMEVLKL